MVTVPPLGAIKDIDVSGHNGDSARERRFVHLDSLFILMLDDGGRIQNLSLSSVHISPRL